MKLLEKDFIDGKYMPFKDDEVPQNLPKKRPVPAPATSAKAKKPRKSAKEGKIICISAQSGLCLQCTKCILTALKIHAHLHVHTKVMHACTP